MRKFKLNKLVRDKILAKMLEMGQVVAYRKLNDTEFREALQAKILEEAKEVDLTSPEVLDELADLLEVIEAAAWQQGASMRDLQKIKLARKAKRGTFKDRTFIETLTLKDNDPWIKYYAKDSEKFPEQK